jgi:hypothetical protein
MLEASYMHRTEPGTNSGWVAATEGYMAGEIVVPTGPALVVLRSATT